MSEKIATRDPVEELRRAFKLFDDDNTGKISIRNLRRVAKELGDNLSEEELYVQTKANVYIKCSLKYFLHSQAMIDEFDLDQDGEIDEKEFMAIMAEES